MTREEALAIVVADLGQTGEEWENPSVVKTVEMAHKIIRSEGLRPKGKFFCYETGNFVDLPKPLDTEPEAITFGDLLDECEAAAAVLDGMRAVGLRPWYTQYSATYFFNRKRRERLMKPRSPTTSDKGKGGDDRAS